MKRVILYILFAVTVNSYGGTYYVSTTGNNGNPGTILSPWLTWRYAFTTATAGDTVYFRGGTYQFEGSTNMGIGNAGTHDNPICFFNYPDEVPILDFSNRTNGAFSYALVVGSGDNYIHFKGLTFRNMIQSSDVYIAGIVGGDNIGVIFENMTVHGIGGPGYSFGGADSLSFINCDTYDCYDPYNDGGNGDGFQVNNIGSRGLTTFIGCRAWRCSDDGYDNFNNNGIVNYYNCWAMNCGYPEGDGNGFKLGMTSMEATDTIQRTVVNCIATDNNAAGFTENHAMVLINFYNNITFRNGSNGNYYDAGYVNFGDGIVGGSTYRNNISYLDNLPYYWPVSDRQTQDHNSWNSGYTVTADDFVSLDTAQLKGARQSDWSLPDISFGKLAAGSDLIDTGVDVGLEFNGTAPDLGWFETDGGASTATDILTFTLADQTGSATINTTLHTVSIEVDYTADVTNLTPTITLSYGATVIPLSGVARDFTNPVPYTVTAEDGVTHQEWTVTVTQEAEPVTPVPTGGAIIKFGGKIVKR